MATIDCRWDEPTPGTDDWNDWTEAKRLTAQLPTDWKVNVALGSPAPVVIQDASGGRMARVDSIEIGQYHGLALFLRRVVPELLKQLPR
jgi:hypothetical protein